MHSLSRATGVAVACCTLLALASCSWVKRSSTECREPDIPADPQNLPALKAGPGLERPDTRNAIKIPELNEPERQRSKTDPCLSAPPSYGSAS